MYFYDITIDSRVKHEENLFFSKYIPVFLWQANPDHGIHLGIDSFLILNLPLLGVYSPKFLASIRGYFLALNGFPCPYLSFHLGLFLEVDVTNRNVWIK